MCLLETGHILVILATTLQHSVKLWWRPFITCFVIQQLSLFFLTKKRVFYSLLTRTGSLKAKSTQKNRSHLSYALQFPKILRPEGVSFKLKMRYS